MRLAHASRAALVTLALASCRGLGTTGEGTPDARESPQASAEPAPLALAPPATASALPLATEGGPPPAPLRSDERLNADAFLREGVGYTFSAAFRPADVPGPLRAPEVNLPALEAARKKTELRLAIDVTATRMRTVVAGGGFVLPVETEIRARSDRYGHVVVWPGGATYRPLVPGAMRALLGERRFDVAPLATADVVHKEESGKRIGIKTRKVEVATRAAKATFEVGHLDALGEGGVLLCRLLLDLMNAPPQTNVCGTDELPVRAELRWTGHGALGFELTGVLRRTDLPLAPMLVPPSGASFAAVPLPGAPVQMLLSGQELAALRTAPVEIPPPAGGAVTNEEGLVVANATVQLRMLYVDGVPIAAVAPGAREVVGGLLRGRYVMQWRTFLGDALEPPVTVTVPGAMQIGVADAGAR